MALYNKSFMPIAYGENGEILNNIEFTYNFNGNILSAQLKNVGDNVKIKEVLINSFAPDIPPESEFFGEGYQSGCQYVGSLAAYYCVGDKSDEYYYKMPKRSKKWAYNYITVASGEKAFLVGAVSCNNYRVEIEAAPDAISIYECFDFIEIKSGESVTLEAIAFIEDENVKNLKDNFAKLIKDYNKINTTSLHPVMWSSRHSYGYDITFDEFQLNLNRAKANLPQIEYVLIDDGYQRVYGDWLSGMEVLDPKVEVVSMDEISLGIAAQGFKPAIWLAPFIASSKSGLFESCPDFFVQGTYYAAIDSTEPLKADSVTAKAEKDGPWYIVDYSNQHALEHFIKILKTMYDDWGARMFVLDYMIWGALPFGNRSDGSTAITAYRKFATSIRNALPNDVLLVAVNAPLWPSIGVFDFVKTTPSLVRSASVIKSIANFAMRRAFFDGNLWNNYCSDITLTSERGNYMAIAALHRKKRKIKGIYRLLTAVNRACSNMSVIGDKLYGLAASDIVFLPNVFDLKNSVCCDYEGYTEINCEDGSEFIFINTGLKAVKATLEIGQKAVFDLFTNKHVELKGSTLSVIVKGKNAVWLKVMNK